MIQELARKYRNLRHQHPGWRLLVSPRAPLLLSCLKPLFEENREGILYEDAQQLLARAFESFAGDDELEINTDNILQDARRELRKWIRSKLVVERDGKLVGKITAGATSPYLGCGIGYALMESHHHAVGDKVSVGCRDGELHEAVLVELPMYDAACEIPRGKLIDIPTRT